MIQASKLKENKYAVNKWRHIAACWNLHVRVSIFKMYVTVIFESFFTLFFWWVYLAETFLNATFCNIPYPVTYLLSNAWPWKTTEEINVVFICPSVGIFKCNEPLLQINYTRHMDHRSLLCMSPNQIFLAISKLVLSVYLTSCKRGHRSDHLDNQLQAQQYSCSIAENCQTSHL